MLIPFKGGAERFYAGMNIWMAVIRERLEGGQLLQPGPLLIDLLLNQIQCLPLQVLEASLQLVVFVNQVTDRFFIQGVTHAVLHLIERENPRLHHQPSQAYADFTRHLPAGRAGGVDVDETGAFGFDDIDKEGGLFYTELYITLLKYQ